MDTQDSTLRVSCTPPTVDDALALAACGLQIIPCAPRTKRPARDFTDWKDLATLDPEQIAAWWQQYPGANVGYVVGVQRLVVSVNVNAAEGKNGARWWSQMLAQYGEGPPTWICWSGGQQGSFHAYYDVPEGIALPSHLWLTPTTRDVEALGLGHLVILPPSIHPDTGCPYRWDERQNPVTMAHPAEAPQWLLTEIRLATATHHDQAKKPRTDLCEIFPKGVETPSRPPTLTPSDCSALGASNKVPYPPPGTLFESAASSPNPKGPADKMVALASDPDHLPGLLSACGLDPGLQVHDAVRCPFHDDAHPSASLLGPTAEHPSYAIKCHACKTSWPLVDIFHIRESGNVLAFHTEIDATGKVRNHHALRVEWTTRLLEKANVLRRRELGAPALPAHAPPDAKALWAIAMHLHRIRAETRSVDAPFPFTLRFIQDWAGPESGWSLYRVNTAKRWLILHGYLFFDHKEGIESYWRIGSLDLRRARREVRGGGTTEKVMVADIAATEVIPRPEPTPACPEAHEFSHDTRACALCTQARLLERRAQAGIWVDPEDPYGKKRGMG